MRVFGRYYDNVFVVIVCLVLVCLVLMGFSVYVAYQETTPIAGMLEQKKFVPGYMSTTYVKIGEVLAPINSYVPESYKLLIRDDEDGKLKWKVVKKWYYDKVEVGQHLDLRPYE